MISFVDLMELLIRSNVSEKFKINCKRLRNVYKKGQPVISKAYASAG